ncbi:alpha/beta hydrolase [Streptomyces tubbatahanensis]|uniref:Alpha/beta hydrolase n=1 Tax=Streptomyces tubbatahanensis TaxID=2923272 RepID=A0ABY3XVQ7_9ACTN|nr:alpha/beta hydrolase [Streptomyces tubbatahanensis]UNS98578.1 alpha/beta hydrolase [Streptomyces tubbatahanensis]
MNPVDPALLKAIPAPHPDVAPLPPAAVLDDGVRMLRGVPYALPERVRPLELDLWLPAGGSGKEPAPVVLYAHGGAWMRGRRDDLGMRTRDWRPGLFARIAAAGCAVACVDYRLSGEAPFPAPLTDLRAALRWLTLRAAELGIDTGRTVAWGESAGGHLVSLLALSRPEPGLTPPVPHLAGAVVWYGPSDLTAPRGGFSPAGPGTPEARLLGAAPADVPELAREASPLRQVHAQAPPFFLVHGAADTMVDPSHSEDLAAALRQAGGSARLRLVPGADHGWFGAEESDVADVFDASLRFARDAVS